MIATRQPFFARFDTPTFRGFMNLLLAVLMSYAVVGGFLILLAGVTWLANTQYVPYAEQNPFVSGMLLAGAVCAVLWWTRRGRYR